MPHSDDEDALLESLEKETENDPSISHLREQRLQQLHSDFNRVKQLKTEGYGTYEAIADEKRLLDVTTSTKRCVALAPCHLTTRFLRINVEHAPFLVTKLGIKILPCVIAFIDGVSADRIVGFEGLGYSEDTFKTADLEKRLVGVGLLEKAGRLGNGLANGGAKIRNEKIVDEDEGDDWD